MGISNLLKLHYFEPLKAWLICLKITQNISVNVSCMGCSTAEWQEGLCFSNHSGVWGAFNCADDVARQLYL